jgi:hypothetical protein
MYPFRGIDKAWERGETWPVDPEVREAFERLGADLRGETQTLAVDLRGEMQTLGENLRGEIQTLAVDLRDEMQTLGADLLGEIRTVVVEMRAYVDDRLQTTSADTRRYFDVAGESLRSDFRAVVDGLALLSQRVDRGFSDQAGRTDGLEGRVERLEVRVTDLEDGRKPRRARRRR